MHDNSSYLLIASVFIFALGAGCSPTTQSSQSNAKALTPPDESLTLREYLSAGVPPHHRAWDADDFAEAVQALSNLSKKGPHVLPRLNSSRSGVIFDRIISTENFVVANDSKQTDVSRQESIARQAQAMRQLTDLYVYAAENQKVGSIEVIHLAGTSIRLTVESIRALKRFLSTLNKEDPTYAARMNLLSNLKVGLAPMVMEGLNGLNEDTGFQVASRQRLLEYHLECFPEIVAFLQPEVQSEAMKRLEELCVDAKLNDLRPNLLNLRDSVKAAVSKANQE